MTELNNLIKNTQLKKSIKSFIQKYNKIETTEKRIVEKKYDQVFWDELTSILFGTKIEIKRQHEVSTEKSTKWMDLYLPDTKVIIEQKSSNIDLDKPQQGHEGKTPYEQAFEYRSLSKTNETANWIIVSNFKEFHIYNMNLDEPQKNRIVIKLEDLPKCYKEFDFLMDRNVKRIIHEKKVSAKAGLIIGKIYNLFIDSYKKLNIELTSKDYQTINIICVRLVFCLYAEDSNIFTNQLFGKFLTKYRNEPSVLQIQIAELFKTLDTPVENRKKFINEDLKDFPYVNGGLFSKEIEIPYLSNELISYLIDNASEETDWSSISPTIFGSIFEGTLNTETRSTDGIHFTSIENIHKVIDSLFLDDLHSELNNILQYKQANIKVQKLLEFQNKIANLKFLDPACGSGNFLTETYISLRKIEDQILQNIAIIEGSILNSKLQVKVSINQFYGIEINDFAVDVAKTALWIAEFKCLQNTLTLVYQLDYDPFLPLRENNNILLANALKVDWNDLIHNSKLNYIMGNPPFVGARNMNPIQKKDVESVWKGTKNLGNLDYVTCWYQIASEYMKGTKIQASLVSTNSICQGEQAGLLWKPMFDKGIVINNAYRTFIWDNESPSKKAHVYCVIVQFSYVSNSVKKLFAEKIGIPSEVSYINQYLLPFKVSFLENRNSPLSDVPIIGIGNKPIDGGYYLFKEDEMKEFIKKEPQSAKYFKKWYGADEFINGYCRYCLWLGDCSPKDIKNMPLCLDRVKKVKEIRLASKSAGTRKLAEKPTRFHVENMPKGDYIVLPETSSENRKYIPFGFMNPDVFCSNRLKLMPNATLFNFGVLTSIVHMAWMRIVTGRLELRYSYSIGIVYNNFVWVKPTEQQKEKIEKAAQSILDARNKYPESTLADLYDSLTMPPELRKAHENNDKAVLELYGLSKDSTEEQIVELLFKLYDAKITGNDDTRFELL